VTAALEMPEARRQALGRQAQEIVLAEHSADKRARQLVKYLEEIGNSKARAESAA